MVVQSLNSSNNFCAPPIPFPLHFHLTIPFLPCSIPLFLHLPLLFHSPFHRPSTCFSSSPSLSFHSPFLSLPCHFPLSTFAFHPLCTSHHSHTPFFLPLSYPLCPPFLPIPCSRIYIHCVRFCCCPLANMICLV